MQEESQGTRLVIRCDDVLTCDTGIIGMLLGTCRHQVIQCHKYALQTTVNSLAVGTVMYNGSDIHIHAITSSHVLRKYQIPTVLHSH